MKVRIEEWRSIHFRNKSGLQLPPYAPTPVHAKMLPTSRSHKYKLTNYPQGSARQNGAEALPVLGQVQLCHKLHRVNRNKNTPLIYIYAYSGLKIGYENSLLKDDCHSYVKTSKVT